MLRGNNRQDIFFSDADRIHLNQLVGRATRQLSARVHSFCWMTNHIHMAMQVSDAPLGRLMQWIASRYAFYLNRRLGATGHVFERRYRAVLVDIDSYAVQLVRYIHLNPVAAGLVDQPGGYAWSSHRYYLAGSGPDWLETRWVLSMFGSSLRSARSAFERFVLDEAAGEAPAELFHGCADDDRLTGADLLLGERGGNERGTRSRDDLDSILHRVCERHGVPVAAVRGRSKERHLVRIRREIASEAYRQGIASIAEISRALNRSGTAITRLLRD